MKNIKDMTLSEKIGQLSQRVLSTATEDEIINLVKERKIGSCILADNALAGNSTQRKVSPELINRVQKCAMENGGIPLLFGRDVVHGMKIIYPIPLGLAASWDMELIEKVSSSMAEEAFENGINLTFAPMLDLSRDPRWGRVIESPGEDPYLGSCFAKASVRGIQGNDLKKEGKIAACLKHFIGYGAGEGGRDYNKSEISDYTLYNMYLPAFAAGVEEGSASVMNSFSEINGQSCVSNEKLFRKLLKETLCFDGFVNSDWGSIEQLKDRQNASDHKECAFLALKAGIDVEMATGCYSEHLEQLLTEQPELVKYLDEGVERILRIKERLGLFENPYVLKKSEEKHNTDIKKRLKLSEDAAAKSAVLLKNDNVLPLNKNEKIMLAGVFLNEKKCLQGAWAPDGEIERVITVEEAIKNEFENTMVMENTLFPETWNAKQRICDTVVFTIGEFWLVTGERSSMGNIEIPQTQVELAKKFKQLGKKVICLVFAGRPLALSEIMPYADAILYMWHPGTMGAVAAAKLLSGTYTPCGKLPMTMLHSTGQIPLYYNTPPLPVRFGIDDMGYYSEPYFPSYKDIPSKPLFPFGFGLSYTTFTYSHISCNQTQLTYEEIKNNKYFEFKIKIKNSGERDGAEVIQCYISDCISVFSRPVRELKGFQKVFLNAGEEKEITFHLGYEELSYFYTTGEKVLEKGDFRIFIGSDCCTKNEITVSVK